MPPKAPDERARGVAYAVTTYLAWGLLPLYFKALRAVPAVEVLAHRVVWSLALLAAIVVGRSGARGLAVPARRLPLLAATAALIATNWLVYIWAVQSGRVLEASLGYFVNPLVNVLLGVLFLGEALGRRQRIAVALAGAGVAVLVVRAGTFPWVALVLAASFGLYGLLRKRAAMDPVGALLAETALLGLPALGYLAWRAAAGAGAFGSAPGTTLLLATMGLVQYLTPTGQFLLAVLLYREPFRPAHAAAFGLIWSSLALYSWDAFARARAARTEPEEPA